MPDEVQKKFVRSFITYLKKQTLTPDSQESLEVAVQCLQAAFDLDESTDNVSARPADSAHQINESSTTSHEETDLFELFQSAYIERNPDSLQLAENIKNEGNRLMKDGKYNEALLQYNRAITFDPKNPIFYCNRAAAFIRLGDNERAVTDCKSALVYNPNYGKAYGRLGIAYSNLGKYDEAQQAYTKAIELEPENQDYRNNLEVARNARNQAPLNTIPQLSDALNAMLSNPGIRNLFGSAEIDLEQLQNMSRNPMVMNAIVQMFSNWQGGNAPAAGGPNVGQVPPMPNDILQLFQSFASQLSNPQGGNYGAGNGSSSEERPPQPPPS